MDKILTAALLSSHYQHGCDTTFAEPTNQYLEFVRYGSDNKYPELLKSLADHSPLHNAILTSKVDHVCGQGIEVDGVMIEEMSAEDLKLKTIINTPNENDDINELLRKLVFDYIFYGGYAIECQWNSTGTYLSRISHIDFASIRCGIKDRKGNIPFYWYSRDWDNFRKTNNIPVKIFPFDKTKAKENPTQLLYIREYRSGLNYYPKPAYIGAVESIITDVNIKLFQKTMSENSMSPGLIVTFVNGQPTDEDMKVTKRKFENAYSGPANADKAILNFVDGPDQAPIITRLAPDDLANTYISLQQQILEDILQGHKITSPMLVGIKTEGQLGGASELETAFTIYQKSIIQPIQQSISSMLTWLYKNRNINSKLTIKTSTLL